MRNNCNLILLQTHICMHITRTHTLDGGVGGGSHTEELCIVYFKGGGYYCMDPLMPLCVVGLLWDTADEEI